MISCSPGASCDGLFFGGILGSAPRAEIPVSPSNHVGFTPRLLYSSTRYSSESFIHLKTGWAQDAWLQWSNENWFFHLDISRWQSCHGFCSIKTVKEPFRLFAHKKNCLLISGQFSKYWSYRYLSSVFLEIASLLDFCLRFPFSFYVKVIIRIMMKKGHFSSYFLYILYKIGRQLASLLVKITAVEEWLHRSTTSWLGCPQADKYIYIYIAQTVCVRIVYRRYTTFTSYHSSFKSQRLKKMKRAQKR